MISISLKSKILSTFMRFSADRGGIAAQAQAGITRGLSAAGEGVGYGLGSWVRG